MTDAQANDIRLTGPTVVLPTADLDRARTLYEKLGFHAEYIGGPISHLHMTRSSVTLLLHPVADPGWVRPNSSIEGGLYFDVFCYAGDGGQLKRLYEECLAAGAEIARDPSWNEGWSEFVIRDADGYRIAFGG
ncbi:VOC family protein [Paenibacillus flagellatus]|uniref:Bleomycin resistance protein n=1 Tax=Paenibacillus flagellatus TaxID=2211139 RepID=A0A2V5KQX7_9BACL|nr:VOC family protein [Paenibacillus flagellatus]PYI53737.1 bleomycin resistance protein [Paenibacillus flagellatus]